MRGSAKPIRLSEHAKQQLQFRGATEQEVAETIRMQTRGPAELGRLECQRNFAFNSEWNKNYYATKQVGPIFAEESDEIVVVTVYVYYF
jgi:hypothetical protein